MARTYLEPSESRIKLNGLAGLTIAVVASKYSRLNRHYGFIDGPWLPEREADRTVITAHDVRVNFGGNDALDEAWRDEEIVDAPSDVARASVGEIGPPGVVTVALMEDSKSVDKACVHEVLEAIAFLAGVTGLAHVRFGIGQILGRVRHVQVATEDDWFGAF